MIAGVKVSLLRVLLLTGLIATTSIHSQSAQSSIQGSSGSGMQRAQVAANYAELPLSFEANFGQTDKSVKFNSKGGGYGLYLTGDAAVLSLSKSACDARRATSQVRVGQSAGCKKDTALVSMRLVGTQGGNAGPVGEERLPGVANYFVGSDPANWRTGVPTYAKVRYSGVYPGIDLLYYGNRRQLEYDFVVAPNADLQPIRLQISGASRLSLNNTGDLILSAQNGEIAFHKPVIYQEAHGRRNFIAGRFILQAHNTVSFAVNAYNHSLPLVIDPVLAYSTYIGGSGTDGDSALAIALDSSGDAYVTGQTNSTNFPLTSGSYQQANNGSATSTFNGFVSKLNAAGTALVYSTYLGGTGNTQATALAVDSSGNVFVTGHTFATNFPTTSGAFQTASVANATGYTAFVTELNPAGTALIYSTFLGGSGNGSGTGETTNALALDSSDDVYVAGYTDSANFPVTSGAFQATNGAIAHSGSNAFVTKLAPAGNTLIFSTLLGGGGQYDGGDVAWAMALDSSDNVYVTGSAGSSNFPTTTGAYLTTNPASVNSQTAAFVAKVNSTGTALIYSTYVGGSKDSGGYGIAVNSSGDAYITGSALYTDFPVTAGAYQATNNASSVSASNAFVTELNATGSGLVYSTWLGGSGAAINSSVHVGDTASAIALDASGDAYVTGAAYSSNFPVTSGAVQTTNEGAANKATNAFVTELNPAGTALVYSTFLGGTGYPFGLNGYYHGDVADALALDSSGNIYIAGAAYSSNFPVTTGAFQTSNLALSNSGSNVFVSKLTMGAAPVTATTTTLTSSANPQTSGSPVTFTATVAASSGTSEPAGSVVFTVDGATASTVALNGSGVATYATSTLAAGSHTVSANYGGSSGFGASTSSTLTQTISAPTAVAPKVSPAAGTYSTSQSVTLSSSTSGATIYYTTNGTTPTTSSTKYSSAISVSATETIEAIAVASGYNNSAATSATYTITPAAATPAFSVAAGTYSTTQSVTLSDTTSGATIYYTTNGATPTTSSTKYSSAISVSATETIEALAVASGYSNSAVASAKYTISTATPTFSLAAGSYTGAQLVTISDATSGATIYYTTTGTAPTTASTKYSSAISVSASETIEAIAVVTGGTGSSATATAKYTITAPTPKLSVAAGTYTAVQSVTLSDTASGATIYYTTNGTTPTTSSTKYSTAISVSATETIEAIAVVSGESNSAVASAAYTINLKAAATPTFSVAAGTYSAKQSVTLSDTTSGATIYYTTNGTTPTTSSTKYSKAISVSATESIKAIAVASGYSTSAVASAAYTIN